MMAMDKESVELDVDIRCPECGSHSEIRFSRKKGNITIECSVCGVVRDETVWYGAGAVIGDSD